MVSTFVIYDLVFLAIFTIAVVVFLYTRRHNLKREGILYLYRTQWGIKLIDKTAKKYQKILSPLQYVVVATGYALMAAIIWFFVKFSWFYISSPTAARDLKIPVLVPLVPYLPSLFNLDFLPPFYFTYWIIILALIAIPHEFAHGIFARLNKIKIHSTGFGFLGPFLAAFVEQDEKDMTRAKKFPQLSILAAGTFANIVVTILFALLLWGFFAAAFTPAGVYFNSYSTSQIDLSQIDTINGVQISNLNDITIPNETFIEITSNSETYHATPSTLKHSIDNNLNSIIVFDDTPAFNSKLSGAISEINGEKITSHEELRETINSYNPGDEITIKTITQEGVRETEIILGERNGEAFLGIGIIPLERPGIAGFFFNLITSIKNPLIYYESVIGDFGLFIYNLLWWTVLVSISVALVNMLPVGIFDGGRFFYLTIWGITGSEKIGRNSFKISTWVILLLIFALMAKWIIAFI